METVRSFIAIELSSEIHDELAKIQAELKKADADVKWVEPEGIHLTLKFLGEVSLQMVEKIKKLITQLAKESRQFEIKLGHLGAFPTTEHPRVIWVGIEQGKDESATLAQDLEEKLFNLGFAKEKRRFAAHLTLGRVRSAHHREQLKKLLQSVHVEAKTMQAEKLVLFKSTLTPQGAIYQPLSETKLT